MAALGDAARLGRGAASVQRRPPARAGPRRGATCCSSRPPRGSRATRDIGTGLLPARDSAPRGGAARLADWRWRCAPSAASSACGRARSAVFAIIVGLARRAPSSPRTSRGRARELQKLGGARSRRHGRLGFYFIFFASRSASSPAPRSRPPATRKPSRGWKRCSRCRSGAAAGWGAGCARGRAAGAVAVALAAACSPGRGGDGRRRRRARRSARGGGSTACPPRCSSSASRRSPSPSSPAPPPASPTASSRSPSSGSSSARCSARRDGSPT